MTDDELTPIETEKGRWHQVFVELREIKALCAGSDARAADLTKRVSTLESRVMYVPLAVAVIALACSLVAVSQTSATRSISGAKPAAAAR